MQRNNAAEIIQPTGSGFISRPHGLATCVQAMMLWDVPGAEVITIVRRHAPSSIHASISARYGREITPETTSDKSLYRDQSEMAPVVSATNGPKFFFDTEGVRRRWRSSLCARVSRAKRP